MDFRFVPEDDAEDGTGNFANGALAPLDHCDDNGDLATFHGEQSYAHIVGGVVWRYHRRIGTVSDVTATEVEA